MAVIAADANYVQLPGTVTPAPLSKSCMSLASTGHSKLKELLKDGEIVTKSTLIPSYKATAMSDGVRSMINIPTYCYFVIDIQVSLLARDATTRKDVLENGLVGIVGLVVCELEGELESRVRIRLEDDVVRLPTSDVEIIDRVRQLCPRINIPMIVSRWDGARQLLFLTDQLGNSWGSPRC